MEQIIQSIHGMVWAWVIYVTYVLIIVYVGAFFLDQVFAGGKGKIPAAITRTLTAIPVWIIRGLWRAIFPRHNNRDRDRNNNGRGGGRRRVDVYIHRDED